MVAFAHALMRIPAEHRVHIQRALGRMFGIQPLCPNLYISKEMFLNCFAVFPFKMVLRESARGRLHAAQGLIESSFTVGVPTYRARAANRPTLRARTSLAHASGPGPR